MRAFGLMVITFAAATALRATPARAQQEPPDSVAARLDSLRGRLRDSLPVWYERLRRHLALRGTERCPMPVARPRRSAVPMPTTTPDTTRTAQMPTARPHCRNPLAR